LRRLLRPLLITSFGAVLAGATVWSAAGMVAMSGPFALGSSQFLPRPHGLDMRQARLPDEQARPGTAARLAAAKAPPVVAASYSAGGKSARLALEGADASDSAARFDAAVKQAGLTSEKLASLFPRSGSTKSSRPSAKAGGPAPERFAAPPAVAADRPQTLLAYADPSPTGAGAALSALLTPPAGEDLASQDPDLDTDDMVILPDYENTPPDGPLPQLRPRGERKPVVETEQPDGRRGEEAAAPRTGEPRKANERETAKPQKLAYARPSNPTEKKSNGTFGQTLRNLFGGGTRAGNGVAVYDISAAKVYMPDGSVLEAHSGIGKMADNPRYVHVKMNGPTPPHTYNLRMREKRFHGVEAIRMLPVDGRNKHGRDGFLTHSYLLRGGRAESHGCVAFKDYNRFLNAFKQGKVKQLVVVPSGGRATMVASNGRST
jgi:hypothetical protein